jgi:IS5 family transposase
MNWSCLGAYFVKNDRTKIRSSLHESEVVYISKGKEHKKYEFGSKVSITITQNSGVIIEALNIPGNDYDGHTLDATLEQQQRLTGHALKEAFVDRRYRGRKEGLVTSFTHPNHSVIN